VLVLNALVRKSMIYSDLHNAAIFLYKCEKFALQIHQTLFVGHSFRVEGETWYFFIANSPLCILI